MTNLGHYWVRDDDLMVCGGCDCYRGSRASLRACPAFTPPKPETRDWMHKPFKPTHRSREDGSEAMLVEPHSFILVDLNGAQWKDDPEYWEDLEDYDGAPCCPDPGCSGRPCDFPGYAKNH
jgi:hypothetical protein